VAPARLSTINDPPSFSWSFGARIRAMVSVDPPGGNGTIRVTGLSGQASAIGLAEARTSASRIFFMESPP
jgi:hypothetical protein